MAINIKFDLVGNPEPPTIILANRNGSKLGQLNVNVESIELSDKFNDVSEFSFTLNKYNNDKITNLWDKVVNFKLIYCKEWDMWFEATVELDEETETVKTVFCKQLGQAELSQLMLYNIEVNTEKDIDRDDYKITILYNEKDTEASLLHRLLKDKAPHYSIIHVDSTIENIQRSFSFDGTTIYDAFQEVAEEIGCLFVFHSNSDENGNIQRTISVYDLEQNCLNADCKHRGEFTDKCPKCGSTNIKYGYGEDTLIFVTADELAADGIQLTTDTDSVKNCFKLEAGDDLMTATIRNCNPNGTDYIWYFSDYIKEDMSDELVDKIESYDEKYKDYYDNYESEIDAGLLGKYNELITKYSTFKKDLQPISVPIKGYSALMNTYYNVIDLSLYLESGLMPNIEIAETNAKEQAGLLTVASFSPVAIANINTVSLATANSAVLAMAKIIVKSTFKVEIKSSELTTSGSKKYWNGSFIVTNYSDEEDVVDSNQISVELNDDMEAFVKQKIDKALNKENTDDYSISGLFAKGYDDFNAELKKYALNPLIGFRDAAQACIDILIEQGVSDGDTWGDPTEGSEGNLYERLYIPYYNKLKAIEAEIKIREDEVGLIKGTYDLSGTLITEGLGAYIEKIKAEIQDSLNFEKYLGKDLWVEFCSYRREDKYSNDNYISDGLNNAELFKKANEFIEVAKNEIYKSSELQHSISTTLKNLLAIPKFKGLVSSFNLGNWIRVQVNDEIYKLRLLSYDISYKDFDNIPVEFSDVIKIKNGITDVSDILSQASSMATSYSSIQRQAKQGNEAQSTIEQWLSNGLNTAFVQIQSNDTEEITYTKNGLLGRSYSDITGEYSPEQFKLTHNIMAYTADNWKTVSTALGKHGYTYWDGTKFVDDEDYGLSTKFVTAGYVTGSQIIGGEIVSSNYKEGESGTYLNLIDGDFDFAGGKIVYDTKDNTVTLKGVTIEWSDTNKPDVEVKDITGMEDYLDQLDELEQQLSGRVQTYSQSDDPSADWSDTEKSEHVGDLWFNPDDGLTKRWNGISWDIMENSGLIELAQSKAQIFMKTPTPPYYEGDLWVQGSAGDILHCVTAKSEGQSYSASDWEKSSKYTDDSALTTFVSGEYANDLKDIESQLDKKARSWYQPTDPSLTWDTEEDHEGDLWYNSSSDSQNTYIYDNGAWKQTSVPKSLFDTIDGIASIYVTTPDNPVVGDLLIPSSDIGSYKTGKVYRYNGSSWIEISYTDDTKANSAYNLANSAKSLADSAKSLGDTLVSGLGFQETKITGEYVISPVIAGGHLLIGDTSGVYAEIATNGKLTCTGADIKGDITATSLTLGSGVSISSNKVSGLSTVATSGKYSDLSGTPTIPSTIDDLLNDGEELLYADDVSISSTTSSNGVTTQSITVGDKKYTSIISGDFVLTDLGIGTNTDDGSKSYTCISTNGLLTAKNAMIYGTIYATNGEFSGDITGSTFTQSDGNFSIDEQGIITGKELSIDNEISTSILNVDTIGNQEYQKTLMDNVTLYVNANTGDDSNKCKNNESGEKTTFQTLQGAINSIPKFMNGRYVYIELETDVVETVDVRHFSGGLIFIYLAGHTIYGAINNYSNYHIRYYGGTLNGGGTDKTGVIHPSTGFAGVTQTTTLTFNGCNNAQIRNLKIYGADNLISGTTNKIGVLSQYQASVYASDIEFVNVNIGFYTTGCGIIHSAKSAGVASTYGFYATLGGTISLSSANQCGGSQNNYAEAHGGSIRMHAPTFATGGTSTSTNTASTAKVNKSVVYTSSKGNSIRTIGNNKTWRSDNTPKVGVWDSKYGSHTAWWFFGDLFENISKKDVYQIDITFTRNSGGYSADTLHYFYAHNYKSQPTTTSPSYDSTRIGSVSVGTSESATIKITDTSIIAKIIASKGICSIPPSQSQTYYSVMSGTMKVKFYYTE